jgi:hypothetical protein
VNRKPLAAFTIVSSGSRRRGQTDKGKNRPLVRRVCAKWSISQLTVGLGTMVFVRPKGSADPGRPEHLSLGVQPLQECLQSGAIEFPGKRAGLTIAELLVQQQSLLYLL